MRIGKKPFPKPFPRDRGIASSASANRGTGKSRVRKRMDIEARENAGPDAFRIERGLPVSLVGRNIDAFCSRCRLTLAHVVLCEVAGTVRRVQCRTCGTQHGYLGPRPDRRPEIPAERPRGVRGAVPVPPADSRQWEKRSAEVPPDAVVWDYRLTERYEKGDVIQHPQFGRGFVVQIPTDTSMDVLFRWGRKRMAMNRGPESGLA